MINPEVVASVSLLVELVSLGLMIALLFMDR